MSVIYVLLAISVIIAVSFFIAFIVAVKKGQYDDSYTPSVRMLFEDELLKEKPNKTILTKKNNN
jgi:cbb3-type cytochrome oxidase maturation protein